MALNSPAKGASAAQVEAVRVSNQAIIDQYVVDTVSLIILKFNKKKQQKYCGKSKIFRNLWGEGWKHFY